MNDSQEYKADVFKYSEIKGLSAESLEGGSPANRSIRKRGFYRAVKRKEAWALI